VDAANGLDIDHLRGWIGTTQEASDMVTTELVRRFNATLVRADGPASAGSDAPLAIHWCLSPPASPTSTIGLDGHPRLENFMPPVPLPRRMWAGGVIQFRDRLRIGENVRRHSRIADVVSKSGKSGRVCFVCVDHVLATERGVVLEERQDIVFRDSPNGAMGGQSNSTHPNADVWSASMQADAVTLFRYSALTFNAHKIHYDRSYVGSEGYPDLVVHGPLQASFLMHFAEHLRSAHPARFVYRGLEPLFASQVFRLAATESRHGLDLHVVNQEGAATMSATATW
jgi:3-methylfumaryl-CoA hydratase